LIYAAEKSKHSKDHTPEGLSADGCQ